MEKWKSIRDFLNHKLYVYFLRRIFFQIDPERIHNIMISFGNFLGKYSSTKRVTSLFFGYENDSLKQHILGLEFANPIGLAAGFDKDVQLTQILSEVGFGFMEGGSVTGESCEGNPKPRLWRLKESKSLLVYYGLKNEGCERIAGRLKGKKIIFPLGISVAKTNNEKTVSLEGGIEDYLKAFREMSGIADYITINISCPNAFGGCPFTSREYLEALLSKISSARSSKPIFLKLSPNLAKEELDAIIEVSGKYGIDGFVCSNLTKDRRNGKIKDLDFPEKGGMSGKVVEDLAEEQIRYIFSSTKGRFVIIGCGGVFCAEDAYRKIRLGASLIQMITGMIYEGPQVIGQINRGLDRLLKKDGFVSISEAIGVDNE